MGVLEKRTRKDPRKRATELAFLHATEALLNEGASYADLNVSRIAKRAGRTRSAFYTHFEDRRGLLLALIEEVGGDAFTAVEPFLAVNGPVEQEAIVASTEGLLATFREHATLYRAVVEAAGYDEGIAAYWDGIVGRFVEAARERLCAEGFGEAEAASTAAALIWMTERTCYQQAVRGGTGLDDKVAAAGISWVWWSAITASQTPDRPRRSPGRSPAAHH